MTPDAAPSWRKEPTDEGHQEEVGAQAPPRDPAQPLASATGRGGPHPPLPQRAAAGLRHDHTPHRLLLEEGDPAWAPGPSRPGAQARLGTAWTATSTSRTSAPASLWFASCTAMRRKEYAR